VVAPRVVVAPRRRHRILIQPCTIRSANHGLARQPPRLRVSVAFGDPSIFPNSIEVGCSALISALESDNWAMHLSSIQQLHNAVTKTLGDAL
jgi:hypothetical protein